MQRGGSVFEALCLFFRTGGQLLLDAVDLPHHFGWVEARFVGDDFFGLFLAEDVGGKEPVKRSLRSVVYELASPECAGGIVDRLFHRLEEIVEVIDQGP